MSIGNRLKEARKAKGFTQDTLAENIGCSRGVITNIEHDKTTPSPLVLNAICDKLEINPDWLLTGNGNMSTENNSIKKLKILSEIYALSKELNEEEQLYILDLITTFRKHKDLISKP